MGQCPQCPECPPYVPLKSAMDVTKNSLMSTITQSNIIPINNMFIISHVSNIL